MKRRVKYPSSFERGQDLFGTPPVSAQALQPGKGYARTNGVLIASIAKHLSSSPILLSEATHPYIRARLWHVTCRRTIESERRSSALCKTALACGHGNLRACSSSLTTSHSTKPKPSM